MQAVNHTIARHVAGGTTEADRAFLDDLLFDAFRAAAHVPRVHLFCGRGSVYLERDVLPFARFLEELGRPAELELADFADHVPDLGVHFPPYLTSRLSSLLAAYSGSDATAD
jgi:hypothetical protein